MSWLTKNKIKSIMLELVKEPSISGTKQEVSMGKKVTEILGRMNYFNENPDYVYSVPLANDTLGRSCVAALLKGAGDSGKTVIFLSHYDVVDILDYGDYKEYAFNPSKLTGIFDGSLLPEEARRDLEGGNYLFGRGVGDMKSGLAVQLAVLQYFSRHPGELEGNLMLLTVPDEETSSRGAVQGIEFLKRLKDEHELNYRAVINCEPRFPNYPGDNNNYFYTGSMGKAVVMFYCYGKETHVGDALSGLNGNLISAEIIRKLEGNLNFCEKLGRVISSPPTCLKHMDYKRLYSAQIPHNSACYFNLPVINTDPEKMLDELIALGREAFRNILNNFTRKRHDYYRMKEKTGNQMNWEPLVYTYQEFYQKVYSEAGDKLEKEIEGVFSENRDKSGQQEIALKIVDKIQEMTADKRPKIVVGYIPPYYPSVITEGKDERGVRILQTVDKIVKLARERYGEEIKICNSFAGISDLSYFNLRSYDKVKNYLKPNMPNWGIDYQLPLKDIEELDIPVVNLSIYGKDAHKYTERVEVNYSFGILPELVREAVVNLL